MVNWILLKRISNDSLDMRQQLYLIFGTDDPAGLCLVGAARGCPQLPPVGEAACCEPSPCTCIANRIAKLGSNLLGWYTLNQIECIILYHVCAFAQAAVESCAFIFLLFFQFSNITWLRLATTRCTLYSNASTTGGKLDHRRSSQLLWVLPSLLLRACRAPQSRSDFDSA